MQGFHVLTLLAQPGACTVKRSLDWPVSSQPAHAIPSYAPQTSQFARVGFACRPNFATVRKHDQLCDWQPDMATSKPCLAVLCVDRHVNLHPSPTHAAPLPSAPPSHPQKNAQALDVRWAEACCAGTRPCHFFSGVQCPSLRPIVPFQKSRHSCSRCRAWLPSAPLPPPLGT